MNFIKPVLIALLWAASLMPMTARADNSPLRIGVLSPSSGPASVMGLPWDQAARLLLEGWQKNGLAGHPVKFVLYDTEGQPQKAAQLFNRLVENDEVHVVLGPVGSGESLALAPLANQLKVAMICVGTAEAVTKPTTPYVFSLPPPDTTVVDEVLTALKDRNAKRAALIYSLDAYGQSGGKIIQGRAAAFGIELVSVETFSPGDSNMNAQLLHIREKNVDGIILWSPPNASPAIVMKTAKDLGMKTQFYLGNAAAFNGFIDQAGAAADGAYVMNHPILAPQVLADSDSRKPVFMRFSEAYRARWKVGPDQTAGGALDAVTVVEEAVKLIPGPITRDSLRDAIEKVSMCGSYGCRKITAQDHRGHVPGTSTVLMQVRNSKWERVQR